jgi:hypothetical protein
VGREKLISFGQFPDVSLKQARERRNEARKLIAAKVDASAKRKADRAAQSDTFEAITREWLDVKAQGIDERTRTKRLARFEPLTGGGKYLFPSLRTAERPISNNTLNAALRRLGFSGDEMVSHGFRSMASTCLNEQGAIPSAGDSPSISTSLGRLLARGTGYSESRNGSVCIAAILQR